ncbi:hypothetical protein [Methylobacterium oryzae]|uniref:hypothetical protein n=1 Tax=Methylobacterium oryzae TaxID=334852 RepID=UPI002F35F49E
MYNYRETEDLLGKRVYFPNVSEEAHFAPQSQTIHLRRITAESFNDALRRQDTPKLRIQFGTMLHELTHWADMVGTLWGREYIRSVYGALRLMPNISTTGTESEFYKFIDLHDATRRMMMPKYFRVVNKDAKVSDPRRPWRIQLSAGREYDPSGRLNVGRPILFTRFDDHDSGDQVARQPIVSGALLEVNAIWSEIATNYETLAGMTGIDKIIEEKEFHREQNHQLYHPDLTLYTAPAHLLAMTAKTKEVAAAYHLASRVAHLAMNLREDDFNRLEPPPSWEAWTGLFEGFKKSRDRGFAYGVICAWAEPWEEGQPSIAWLDEALRRAGLDSSTMIYAAALRQMKSEPLNKNNDALARAENYILSLGAELLVPRGYASELTPQRLAKERIVAPPMFDPDGNLIDLSSGLFDRALFSPEEAHDREAALFTWTQNFLDACR